MIGSWGSSGHPDCPQMTDVSPNRWGEPMIRLKGMTIKDDDLKAGEEVSDALYSLTLGVYLLC
jgi:hypothetical protein